MPIGRVTQQSAPNTPAIHHRWLRAERSEASKNARKRDRKSTRLNSSHGYTSYAVFCLNKLFHGYAPKLVERLRRRIAAESPSHIHEHPHAIRMTLLAALVFQRTQAVTYALITLLIQIV